MVVGEGKEAVQIETAHMLPMVRSHDAEEIPERVEAVEVKLGELEINRYGFTRKVLGESP